MSFPEYETTKDSNVPWIGKVPASWDVIQARRLFIQNRDPALPNDEQLSATQKYGVLPQSKFMELQDQKVTLALSGLNNFKHVEADDFVISLRSFQGGIEHSPFDGCVSPAYTVLRPKRSICPPFWKYALKSVGYIEALQAVTDGIRDGKNISYEQFGKVLLPLVPKDEQITIANFLDAETAKIDALVTEQRRLIELLKEKRQAVISHAVTKGLDPSVPMKPSGIQWIGDVPEHWSVVALKYLTILKSGDGITGESIDETGDYPVFGGNGLRGFTNAFTHDGHYVIIGRQGALCGNVNYGEGKFWASEHAVVATPTRALVTVWLGEMIRSMNLNQYSETAAQPGLSMVAVGNLRTVLPPIEEQREIANFVTKKTTEFDSLGAEAEHAIELLQERRTALISAAVTGKIDVRELAC